MYVHIIWTLILCNVKGKFINAKLKVIMFYYIITGLWMQLKLEFGNSYVNTIMWLELVTLIMCKNM